MARSLTTFRDEFTAMKPNQEVRNAILVLIERWRRRRPNSDPITELQQVIEEMRSIPAGSLRNRDMNTVVRSLGEPSTLATWLDILRDAYGRDGTEGQKICRILLSYRSHSHYGHCQLLMMVSVRNPTRPAAVIPDNMSNHQITHASQWDMTLSIWQPLEAGITFSSIKRSEPQLLVEPAHSHPFDFVSRVVVGTMYQSTYRPATKEESTKAAGRYAGVPLVRVDRIWPPHQHREAAWLETLEDRVQLQAGDSYFLPNDMIYDVEMDIGISASRPTITLMLSSESIAQADVYLEQPMLDFHDSNPSLKDADDAMPFEVWNTVLRDTAAYLRGAASLKLPFMSIEDSFLVR